MNTHLHHGRHHCRHDCRHHGRRPRGQRGATLIVTLIVLVLITLIGVSSLRSTTMEEKMAGNSRDRDKAFQAAEAVTRYCLDKIANDTYTLTKLTPRTVTEGKQHWELPATWADNSKADVLNTATWTSAGLAESPRCIVELLGTGGSYRVTGRAVGGQKETIVMLQATYSIE